MHTHGNAIEICLSVIRPSVCLSVRQTRIESDFIDSLWDFSTTFRRRRNLLSRFRLEIFRWRVGIFSHFFICCFFLFQVHASFSSSQVSIGIRAIVRSSMFCCYNYVFLLSCFVQARSCDGCARTLSVDQNMRVTAQLHTQLSIWSVTALCLDICSHVSLVSPTWHQDNGCCPSHRLAVPLVRLSVGRRAFPVSGASTQYDLPSHVTSSIVLHRYTRFSDSVSKHFYFPVPQIWFRRNNK